MSITATYRWLLRFISIQPEWIQQWISNKNRFKNVKEPEEKPLSTSSEEDTPGKVPNQDWGPFKRIPNVRNIEVKLGMTNSLLAIFGIEAKFKPTFAYQAHHNFGMNKYMNYQIYRLRRLATTNPTEYFKTMSRLMKQSKVLFIIGLNHVKPRWHREYPEWWVKRLYKQYVQISLSGSWKAEHSRKYIPKPNNKKRPLGIPSEVWRVHNHQVANFISLYLEERKFFENTEQKKQHGFRTGKGTKTAWQEILNKVTKADWVYEFDLSRCFPNIHIKAVSKALRKAQVPQQLIYKLERLNLSPLKNPESLLFETKETNEWNKWLLTNPTQEARLMNQHIRNTLEGNRELKKAENQVFDAYRLDEASIAGLNVLKWNTPSPKQTFWDPYQDLEEERRKINRKRQMLVANGTKPKSFLQEIQTIDLLDMVELKEYHKELYKGTEGDPYRGLPQGLPTSPILTITALEHLFIKPCKWNLIMYADDGLIYGNGEPPKETEIIKTLTKEKYGIELNQEKSKFAKLPGQEINLKFLGMRLKGETLSAETREGSVLQYNKHDLVRIYDLLENWNTTYFNELPDSRHSAPSRTPAISNANLRKEKITLEHPHTKENYELNYQPSYWKWRKATSRTHWEELASSRLFGLIQSRLFQGEWNTDITQCFELKFKKDSWTWNYDLNTQAVKLGDMNVFNSTSIACHDILGKLEAIGKIRKKTSKRTSTTGSGVSSH